MTPRARHFGRRCSPRSARSGRRRPGLPLDNALAGKAVLIRKGGKRVLLSEFVVPEPIPERRVGYFPRRPADYSLANRAATNLAAVH